jgi:hypothetical protein
MGKQLSHSPPLSVTQWVVVGLNNSSLTSVQRFRSYELPLEGITKDGREWMATMWNDPVMLAEARDYFHQAEDPTMVIEKYENIFKDNPEIQYSKFDVDWKFST